MMTKQVSKQTYIENHLASLKEWMTEVEKYMKYAVEEIKTIEKINKSEKLK